MPRRRGSFASLGWWRRQLPAVAALLALEPHDEGEERLGGRPVRVMYEKRPADTRGERRECGTVGRELGLVAHPEALGAIGNPALFPFEPDELSAPFVRERLLGGIEHLDQVPPHAARR